MINVNQATVQDIETTQRQLADALAAVGGESGGMEDIITLLTLQMLRFVQGHIEVDTGRTKNSVFPSVAGTEGRLGTNVSYSPFVREAGHGRQFFDYAADVEGPAVARAFGLEIQSRVNRAFG